MGKSEQELQTLVNITARFASKWNLRNIQKEKCPEKTKFVSYNLVFSGHFSF
jgi:hypothetical protein